MTQYISRAEANKRMRWALSMWGMVIHFWMNQRIGRKVTRKQYLQKWTCPARADEYRCILERAGYIKHVKPGVYVRTRSIPRELRVKRARSFGRLRDAFTKSYDSDSEPLRPEPLEATLKVQAFQEDRVKSKIRDLVVFGPKGFPESADKLNVGRKTVNEKEYKPNG